MRWPALAAAAAAVTACSDNPDSANPVDVANAARAAQSDIDNYAAMARAAGKAERSRRPPRYRPSPTAVHSNSLSETPFTPDSAQGAANVVQTYYALLESGRYRQAWRRWDHQGRASGMSEPAFAASFGQYRKYHAEIGSPGKVDAGAGQRYVRVPVKVYGILKKGDRPFTMEGSVTLRRTANIDGATEQQQKWRISASGVRPRPRDPKFMSADPVNAP